MSRHFSAGSSALSPISGSFDLSSLTYTFGSPYIAPGFQGPHSYISPTWYATSPAVPTWNHSAVHVYGKPLATEETAFTTSDIEALVTKYECTRPKPWETKDLAADFYSKLVAAIVAFEMPIERMEGKFKLEQNRS